jgi:hypothetical protein
MQAKKEINTKYSIVIPINMLNIGLPVKIIKGKRI